MFVAVAKSIFSPGTLQLGRVEYIDEFLFYGTSLVLEICESQTRYDT